MSLARSAGLTRVLWTVVALASMPTPGSTQGGTTDRRPEALRHTTWTTYIPRIAAAGVLSLDDDGRAMIATARRTTRGAEMKPALEQLRRSVGSWWVAGRDTLCIGFAAAGKSAEPRKICFTFRVAGDTLIWQGHPWMRAPIFVEIPFEIPDSTSSGKGELRGASTQELPCGTRLQRDAHENTPRTREDIACRSTRSRRVR